MRTLAVDYSMELRFTGAVTDHSFLLRCAPPERGSQTVVSRSLDVRPNVPLFVHRDAFGNIAHRGQCHAPHESFSFRMNAVVQVRQDGGTREPCPPFYRHGTPLTACSREMREFLRSAYEGTDFADGRRPRRAEIGEFAKILCSAVHGRISYTSGATTVRTTAAESFSLGKGVCQDYAHVLVSLCREAGIAARYVCGMSVGEGATHAWAEYFVPDDDETRGGRAAQGRWHGIDPTRDKRVDDSYVMLAVGRDFSDCQVDRGVFCGSVGQSQSVLVRTAELPPPEPVGEYTGHSVQGGADLAGQQQSRGE